MAGRPSHFAARLLVVAAFSAAACSADDDDAAAGYGTLQDAFGRCFPDSDLSPTIPAEVARLRKRGAVTDVAVSKADVNRYLGPQGTKAAFSNPAKDGKDTWSDVSIDLRLKEARRNFPPHLVHIPKTGGTSLEQEVGHRENVSARCRFGRRSRWRPLTLSTRGSRSRGDTTAATLGAVPALREGLSTRGPVAWSTRCRSARHAAAVASPMSPPPPPH